ncbi:hypothetical protein GCM10028805_65240 [Spirosoma harenae]
MAVTPTPIWVVNPYTGEQIDLEPLFRFNAQPRNPLIQPIPFARTRMVLINIEMQYREKFVRGNNPPKELLSTYLEDLHSLIVAISEISAKHDSPASSQLLA